jgi:hypothetical protein
MFHSYTEPSIRGRITHPFLTIFYRSACNCTKVTLSDLRILLKNVTVLQPTPSPTPDRPIRRQTLTGDPIIIRIEPIHVCACHVHAVIKASLGLGLGAEVATILCVCIARARTVNRGGGSCRRLGRRGGGRGHGRLRWRDGGCRSGSSLAASAIDRTSIHIIRKGRGFFFLGYWGKYSTKVQTAQTYGGAVS